MKGGLLHQIIILSIAGIIIWLAWRMGWRARAMTVSTLDRTAGRHAYLLTFPACLVKTGVLSFY